MYKSGLSRVMTLSLLSFLLIPATSCVNEEYDMSEENMNLEVTPFQEGLVLPLGSTDTLKLKEILKDVDADILKAGENGVYSISFKDSFEMTDELSSLSDMISIPDVDFSQKVSFKLKDVDVADVKIEAQDYSFEHELSSSLTVPDVNLPVMEESVDIELGLSSYVPDQDDLELDFPSVEVESHFMSISDDLHIPDAMINDTPISVEGDLLGAHLNTDPEIEGSHTVHLNMSLPNGVNSVEDIVLHEGAAVKVTMELRNSFLHSGSLVPHIDVDLHNIIHLAESIDGDVAHLWDDFTLSEKNNYKHSETYVISSLAVESKDWTKNAKGECVLDKDVVVNMDGNIHFENLMTTTSLVENNRNIDIYIDVEFVNLQIDDVVMDIDPVDVQKENVVSMKIDEFDIPESVEEIKDIVFTPESGIDIVLDAESLKNIRGLELNMESLSVIFPEGLEVEGAVNNVVTFEDVDISEGMEKHIRVLGIELKKDAQGKYGFAGDVKVKADAVADGTIHSMDLAEAGDAAIAVDVITSLELEDYTVKVQDFEYDIDMEPEVIKTELPDDVKEMEEIIIYPEGDPVIVLDIELPEVDMNVVPSDEGVVISFPEMLRFKELPSSYNYNAAENSIALRGSIPEEINLPVDRLVIVPYLDEADGKYYAYGEIKVSGSILMDSAELSKAELEEIAESGSKIAVNAHIPELAPETLNVDSFETNISKEVEVDLIKAEDLPKEIVSLGRVELDDVYLNIAVDASDLPDIGTAGLSVDFTVTLPDVIEVVGASADGTLKLAGELDKNKMIKIDPVKVNAIDMTGKDLSEGVKGTIAFDGVIKLTNASVDVDEWLDQSMDVIFKAEINDIKIAKVEGKVDYKVDPVVQEVDLSSFAETLGGSGMDAELDFNHAHLVLEVATNLGVGIDAVMELVPYYDGKADASKTVKAALALDPAESADKEKVTRFWLANDNDRCPPAGYTFVKADILGILRNLPEKLEFRLDAGTDAESDCVLEPSAEYTLKADYLFELPLEFGEDFNITFRDTLQGLPDILGQLVSKGRIMIAGDITSSLPLGLELKLNLMDSNNKVVPLADGCGTQKISPCGLDGSAVKTDLELVLALKDGVNVSDITAIELLFNATSAGVVGVPVTEESSLHAYLQLVLPEGLTIDLGEMMNNDDEQ